MPATTAAASGPPLYNSTLSVSSVGNLPSVGAEAYSFSEFGNEVNLTGVKLGKVTVMMSSWGCVTGHWYSGDCGTPSGSTFSEPIIFNIYNHPTLGSPYVPGGLIATRTATFNFPYRPSANYTHCYGANAGKWWDKALGTCFNGKAFDITFGFGITLPTTDVVFGIAYNTTDYGYHPYGTQPCDSSSGGCGYDSLNIALTQDNGTGSGGNVSAGSDLYPGTVYQNAAYGSDYCDGGTAGYGFFRLDSPNSASCWGTVYPYTSAPFYIPAVKLAHS